MTEAGTPAPTRQQHQLATVRTGRYFTMGADLPDARHVWIVLHGYAGLAERMLRHFEGIVPKDTRIVAPEGLSRFYLELPRADGGHLARVGAAWMTREHRDAEISDASGWLDNVYRAVHDGVLSASGMAPTITVLAFSQGVATCLRWLARGNAHASRAIMWAGSVATDVNRHELRAALARTEVILVAGTRDEFATAANRHQLLEAWKLLGIPVREVEFDGTHQLHQPLLQELLQINRP